MIDGMRIGPDNGGAARGSWEAVVKGAWHGTNLYFLNGQGLAQRSRPGLRP